MSATIVSDPMVVSAPETTPPPPPTTTTSSSSSSAAAADLKTQIEVEFAKCDCCELTEECTQAYIERIRERYLGKWICGLCAEAIKDEIIRTERLMSTEEAMAKHMSFCKKFKSSGPPPDATIHLITAMRQLLRRSLDSPRGLRSTPTSPTNKVVVEDQIRRGGGPGLLRSESCFPTLSG
ncbi:hypothetical protein Ddye_011762 [Dipteronia dyeriana]|uniref:Uncharacterized protein n=1 Tax=Dipteronia dyeriana TaxID=168575 RepID=A0AAD9X338_9ROSI|nr:hypothetical protein Ddye_011762 [Dipteronia dyeriana]